MGALSVSVIGGPLTMTFEAEALAVVEAPDNREVIGLLSEAYALRWYSGELEQRRQENPRRIGRELPARMLPCRSLRGP
jgi:hypothetical protein